MQMKYLISLAYIAISANSFACVDDNGVFYDLLLSQTGESCQQAITTRTKVVDFFDAESKRLTTQLDSLNAQIAIVKQDLKQVQVDQLRSLKARLAAQIKADNAKYGSLKK
jgi:hypothetical protein